MTEQTKTPGPWDPKTQPQFQRTPAEQKLLERLQLAARINRYDESEAHDIGKAVADAMVSYAESTAPDADVLVITAVPFKTDMPGIAGNAIAQRLKNSVTFEESLKNDILPRFARHAYPTTGAKLRFIAKLFFGDLNKNIRNRG